MTYKFKNIKDPTGKLIYIKNCFDIHKIRFLDQSKHQKKIQKGLQGRLNRLHEDSNVPGISTAAMKLVLSELDGLEVKMKAIEANQKSGQEL